MKRTTVKIPDPLDAQLRHEAERRGMTISALVREALEEHLSDGPRPRRKLLAAGVGQGSGESVAARIEEILASEVERFAELER